jgi:hypothetical protein
MVNHPLACIWVREQSKEETGGSQTLWSHESKENSSTHVLGARDEQTVMDGLGPGVLSSGEIL